jgi:Caulimovirus viroplasmin
MHLISLSCLLIVVCSGVFSTSFGVHLRLLITTPSRSNNPLWVAIRGPVQICREFSDRSSSTALSLSTSSLGISVVGMPNGIMDISVMMHRIRKRNLTQEFDHVCNNAVIVTLVPSLCVHTVEMSKASKGGFYAVHKGRVPGVYDAW